jgi:phosphoribosylaminoimidazole-succinocarboxamide synthase
VTLVLQGKVREVYDVGDDRLLIVTSDRISAYDVVMPTPIPGKGQVLTACSVHWFGATEDMVPNHLISARRDDVGAERAGRGMLVRRLEMLPIECVVRGWLAGSGWRDYRDAGRVCGHALPPGLRQADPLPAPIFTPATKATAGHDLNITREEAADLVGGETLAELERISIALYARAAEVMRRAGIILADTKLELGRDRADRIVLGDEVLTPDSSRLWPEDAWAPGGSPPSFDKQYLRDWLDASGWDHTPPAPELPPDVVEGTRRRYVEAFERTTGRRFADWLAEAGA